MKVPELDEVLWDRIRTLDPATQHLLYLLCVSGKPIPFDTAKVAAQMIRRTATQHIDVLRIGQLVRSKGSGDTTTVEPYHDRVRESVISHLDQKQQRILHKQLAQALLRSASYDLEGLDQENLDLEALVDHWRMAGKPVQAAYYAVKAGDKAMSSFAFENAVHYYRFALEHDPPEKPEERSKLNERLGDALASAGRGKEAADTYLNAVEYAPLEDRFELRRAAAAQLLRSGYMREGVKTLEIVMNDAGITFLSDPRVIVTLFLLTRGRLGLRGYKFHPTDEDTISEKELRRQNTLWDVAMCFGMVDVLRGAYYSSMLLVEALKIGVPERVARALALETVYISTSGLSKRKNVHEALQLCQTLAIESGSPKAMFRAKVSECASHVMLGEFYEAYKVSPQLEVALEQYSDVFWEKSSAEIWTVWSLCHTGMFRELRERMPRYLQDANSRGDRYAVTNLTLGLPNLYWLIDDDPETAIRLSDEVIERWGRESFQLQDYYYMLGVSNAMLYQGRSPHELIESNWKYLRRAQLLRTQIIRLEALHLRARASLKEGILRKAKKHARQMLKDNAAWANPLAQLVLAGVAAVQGEKDEAGLLLADARDHFNKNHQHHYAMIANWQLGKLIGGEEGQALIHEAEAWATSQEIRNWPAFANMLAPGFAGE